MPEVKLHDGTVVEVEVHGEGPALLLPVNPHPIEGEQAEQLRQYGADPALGKSLIDGLSDTLRVIAFDYEGNVLNLPKPETLTPDNVAADFLAVADAVGADRFAYYGYSWLAMVGLQLALRTKRLSALAMGGFSPLDGPNSSSRCIRHCKALMMMQHRNRLPVLACVLSVPQTQWTMERIGETYT